MIIFVINISVHTSFFGFIVCGPGARLVVKVSGGGGGGASCVETPLFNIFRSYIKWSLVVKHVCAGGGG